MYLALLGAFALVVYGFLPTLQVLPPADACACNRNSCAANRIVWACLRGLRWLFYSAVVRVGLGSGPRDARPNGLHWHRNSPAWRANCFLLAAMTCSRKTEARCGFDCQVKTLLRTVCDGMNVSSVHVEHQPEFKEFSIIEHATELRNFMSWRRCTARFRRSLLEEWATMARAVCMCR
jgi:hypothetical protein